MSLTMSHAERQAFLADVHVAILSVDQPDRGPLAVPVWYSYEPGGVVSVITGGSSRKARAITRAGRFTLSAQTEVAPYRYVSVEGPVTGPPRPVGSNERRAMAYRYLGQEFGDLYLAATAGDAEQSVVFRMTPESWLSTDFAKQFG